MPFITPAWFADTNTTWFSAARTQSYRSNSRAWRSRAGPGERLLVAQADRHATISAPSAARPRAASGNVLS